MLRSPKWERCLILKVKLTMKSIEDYTFQLQNSLLYIRLSNSVDRFIKHKHEKYMGQIFRNNVNIVLCPLVLICGRAKTALREIDLSSLFQFYGGTIQIFAVIWSKSNFEERKLSKSSVDYFYYSKFRATLYVFSSKYSYK